MYTKQKYNTDVLCHRSIRLCGSLALPTNILCVSSYERSGWIAWTEKRFPCPKTTPKS